jgi:hypothetical protein
MARPSDEQIRRIGRELSDAQKITRIRRAYQAAAEKTGSSAAERTLEAAGDALPGLFLVPGLVSSDSTAEYFKDLYRYAEEVEDKAKLASALRDALGAVLTPSADLPTGGTSAASAEPRLRYRVFCEAQDRGELPPGARVLEANPGFVEVEADPRSAEALRSRFPVVERGSAASEAAGGGGLTGRAAAPPPSELSSPDLWVLRFASPARPEWLEELEESGVELLQPVGDLAFIVRVGGPERATIARLPFVSRMEAHLPSLRVTSSFLRRLGGAQAPTSESLREAALRLARGSTARQKSDEVRAPGLLIARFFSANEASGALKRLTRRRLRARRVAGDRLVIDLSGASEPLRSLETIAKLPGLRTLGEKPIKRLRNDIARQILARRALQPNPGLTGDGEIIAIADTGLDTGSAVTIHAQRSRRSRAPSPRSTQPKASCRGSPRISTGGRLAPCPDPARSTHSALGTTPTGRHSARGWLNPGGRRSRSNPQ